MTTVWFHTSTPTTGRVRAPGVIGLSIDGPRQPRHAAAASVSTRDATGRLRSASRAGTRPRMPRGSHDFPLDAG